MTIQKISANVVSLGEMILLQYEKTRKNSEINSITSFRASQRRLREETTDSPWTTESTSCSPTDIREALLESLGIEYCKAYREGRFEDILRILDHIEGLVTPTFLDLPTEMSWAFSLWNSALNELKAFTLAMLDQLEASWEKHQAAWEGLMGVLDQFPSFKEQALSLVSWHRALHLLLHGENEQAINLLKRFQLEHSSNDLLLFALEKKLGVELLIHPSADGEETELSRLWRECRFEEILAMETSEPLEDNLQLICYAMLGRYDEALALIDEQIEKRGSCDSDADMNLLLQRQIILFMSGDLAAAKKTPNLGSDEDYYFLYSIVSMPLQLAIKWAEQNS